MSVEQAPAEGEGPSPFADFVSAIVWLALAVAIIVISWRMDRLVHLQASIYSAPGVVPAVLGAALAMMGSVLLVRSARAGALAQAHWPNFRLASRWRLITALVLSLLYAIGIVGSGVPFWLATALYVAVFVFVFRRADSGESLWRSAAVAVSYGLISGGVIHYVFQELFLVRLP